MQQYRWGDGVGMVFHILCLTCDAKEPWEAEGHVTYLSFT